jgi:hypothetical protein
MEPNQQNRLNGEHTVTPGISDGGMFSAALKQVKEATPKQCSVVQENNDCVRIGDAVGIQLAKILARKQTVILSKEQLEEISRNFLYVSSEKSFYERLADNSYAPIKDEHLGNKLKLRFRLSSHSYDPVELPPVKRAMMYIQENHRCEGAIQSLAGYLAGVHTIGSSQMLIKSNLYLLMPDRRPFDAVMELFRHVFGDGEPHYQLDRFLTWLQHAYANAHDIYVNGKGIGDVCGTGLALILCGKSQVGKTYITGLITKIFGKILGQPFKSMTGKTEFNADCAKAIHLSIDDQTGTRTYEQRKENGQNLKAMLSGSAQWIQAKHMNAFTAPLYQRITYSFNDDRDSFSTFPALSDGVRERVLAIKTNSEKWIRFKNAVSKEERNFLDRTITNELPGLLYYVMNDYIPPDFCLSSSFGCKEFIHPSIEQQVEMSTPNSALKELILDYLQSSNYMQYSSIEDCNFSGSASTLLDGILASPAHRDGIRTLVRSSVSFSMRLSDLCTIYSKHFRKTGMRINNCRLYDISVNGFQPTQGKLKI